MRSTLLLAAYLLFILNVKAQIVVSPLQFDPQRAGTPKIQPNYRVASTTYSDTLSLPFFEDFTSTNASIDSIFFLNDGRLQITTLGHHGLQNNDFVSFTFQEPEAAYLNGNYYIQNTGKFSFILYKDPALTNPMLYTSIPNIRYHGYWRRPGAMIGPNPDFTKWVDSGGTYVNNTLCINPPSRNVASFDGLNAKGNPYSNYTSRGITDQLTSLPIDLSGLQPSDSVVISFYWQIQGHGFLPTRKDSLYLLFKDTSQAWNYVWSIRRVDNSLDTTLFYRAIIKITDPAYFHNNFQFNFQCVGSMSAAADNWNVDYIYMDKNWDDTKKFPRDRTISQSQSPLLKTYQSMPSGQFALNKNAALADTVDFTLHNLSAQQTIIFFDHEKIYNGSDSLPMNFGVYNQLMDTSSVSTDYKYIFDKNAFNFSADSLVVKTLLSVQASDPDRSNGVDFTTNNVDSTTTLLYDYYAYDDGTAEKSGGNIAGGPMLVKFTLNQAPDTLTAIDINLSKTYTYNNPTYAQIDLLIANKDTVVIAVIKAFKPSYPRGINNFSRAVPLNGYIPITDTVFFIGYSNPYPDDQGNFINIPIGMDWTYPQRAEVYYKNVGYLSWGRYTGGGNYMIRPVFGKLPLTPVADAVKPQLNFEVFPNPSSGQVTINGLADKATIFDINGKTQLTKIFEDQTSSKSLDGSNLPNGVYFLRLERGELAGTQKLVIVK